MPFDLNNLLSCLNLEDASPESFLGTNLDLDYHRVFGGQILAQSIRSLAAVSDGMSLKSLTQWFPREGDTAHPMEYSVTTHHRGRTFGTYAVTARQGDKIISVTGASLHRSESGFERSEERTTTGSPDDAEPIDLGMVPWEVRVVDGVDLAAREARPARFAFWMKAPALPDDLWLHQALLAHASDLTVIGTALLPVDGLSQADTGRRIRTAVTSHSLWFHQPFRIDDWLLVEQGSPVLSGGRSFGRGDVWAADGRLVASFAQEAVIRILDDAPDRREP